MTDGNSTTHNVTSKPAELEIVLRVHMSEELHGKEKLECRKIDNHLPCIFVGEMRYQLYRCTVYSYTLTQFL